MAGSKRQGGAAPDAKAVPAETGRANTDPADTGSEVLSPREIRRRQRIELSREQILDTAERLFGERGYHETGLKEVAERCEFSVGSLYSFFANKDALYQAVLGRRSRGQVVEMHRIAEDSAPANERLVAMARMQIEYFRKYPAWGRLTTRVLTPGAAATAEVPTGFHEAYGRAIELEAGMIATGQREGVLRAGDPLALARMFSALVTSFHVMDPEVSDEPAGLDIEEFLTFVAQAFAARHAG